MGAVSGAMLIISGVYLTLGLMYLRFWWDERARLSYLAFTISCLSYAIYAWFELGMIKASRPEEFLFYAWWAFVVGGVGITSFAWFGYLHLQGRKWLFLLYAAMRGLALVLHLIMANGINFRQITSVGTRSVLGEALSYPVPVPNPWMLLPHLSHAVLIVFFLDASVRCWRRGEHRMAWTFGTGTILFGAATLALPTMALWGLAPIPLFATCFVLFIVVPMLYELNYDMHRSAMLTEKLAEREDQLTETLEQLQLSALAGNVGMWTRSIDGEILWTSAKAAEIWGFPADAQFTQADLIQKVHAGDLERVMTCLQELASGKRNYQIDFRIVATDGTMRWVSSKGRADSVDGTDLVRGAIVDITKLKLAEEAIRDLTTRLMNAQEKERARLARELHDGLNQSVALLSIQIGMLRNDPRDITYAKQQLDSFAADIERLSEDVHRISYELHPANLNQLGLEAAISTLCRDLSASSDVEIERVVRRVATDSAGLPLYLRALLDDARADGSLVLALWNYAPPDGTGASYTAPPATRGPSKTFTLKLAGVAPNAQATILRLDEDHGNVVKTFDAMGRPAFPSREQIVKLREAGRPAPAERTSLKAGSLTLQIPPQGLVVVTIENKAAR